MSDPGVRDRRSAALAAAVVSRLNLTGLLPAAAAGLRRHRRRVRPRPQGDHRVEGMRAPGFALTHLTGSGAEHEAVTDYTGPVPMVTQAPPPGGGS